MNYKLDYDKLVKALPFTTGRYHIVVSGTNTCREDMQDAFPVDDNGHVRFHSTLEAAYAACDTNRNDVIVLDGQSAHTVAAQVAWSKSRIHVYGLDFLLGDKRMTGQSSKIQFTLGTEAIASLLKVTGVRNSFHGIKFIQNSTNAAALYPVIAAGEASYYEYCSFIFGVASNIDLTTSSELLCGEDSGTFYKCSFGTDVLLTTGARAVMQFDAVSGSASGEGAKSNRFIDCEWIIMSSEANATLIKVADTDGLKFLNRIVNPSFMATLCTATGGVALTNAVASASGLVNGCLAIEYPRTMFITNTCAGVTDQVEVVAPAASNNAHEGVTPA